MLESIHSLPRPYGTLVAFRRGSTVLRGSWRLYVACLLRRVISLWASAPTRRVSLLLRQKANNKRRRKGEVSPLRILLTVAASVG